MSEVKDILKELEEADGSRFNAKKFEKLLIALINDEDFVFKTVKASKGEIQDTIELNVSKEMKEFLKDFLQKFGIDKKEAERVLSPDFKISSGKGLYNFIAVAIYLYIKSGNKFKFLTTEDFRGSLKLDKVEAKEKVRESIHPQTRKSLGKYRTTTKEHYRLGTYKASAPKWLTERVKIED